jgi:hypothetical protein
MNKELLIKVSEQEVEYESSDETNDRRGAESPDQVWILDSIGSSKGDRGRDSSHEEGDGHDKFLHVGRGTGVSDFVGCNIDEDLRASCHSDRDSIEPEGERRDTSTNLTGRNTVAARRGLVDIVLDNSVRRSSNGSDEKTKSHASNRSESDAHLLEKRVDEVVHDWDEDDDCKRVEIVEDIVGNSVGGQRGRLSICGSTQTSIINLLDGEEEENSTGSHCATRHPRPGILSVCLVKSKHPNVKLTNWSSHLTTRVSPDAAKTEGFALSKKPLRPNPLTPAFLRQSQFTAKKPPTALPPGVSFTKRLFTTHKRIGSKK